VAHARPAAARKGSRRLSESEGHLQRGAGRGQDRTTQELKEALRQRQQTGVVTGLLAQRFATTPERAWTLAADNADEETVALLTQD
jgi:hypothetical protein